MLFYFLLTVVTAVNCQTVGNYDIIVNNPPKNFQLSANNPVNIKILGKSEDHYRYQPLRVHASCFGCKVSEKVLVVVESTESGLLIELPYQSSYKRQDNQISKPFFEASRTFCLQHMDSRDLNRTTQLNSKSYEPVYTNISIIVSTASVSAKNVTLSVEEELDHILRLNNELEVNVTSSAPQFFSYKFTGEENMQSVVVKVDSDDDSCATVSIQRHGCPIYDLESNVDYFGSWQSATRSSVFTIHEVDYPNGFHVVLLKHSRSNICETSLVGDENGNQDEKETDLPKTVRITILPGITRHDYIIAVTLVLGILVAFCVLACGCSLWYMRVLTAEKPPTPQNRTLAQTEVGKRIIDNEMTEPVIAIAWQDVETDRTVNNPTNRIIGSAINGLCVCGLSGFGLSGKTRDVLYLDSGVTVDNTRSKKAHLYVWYLLTVFIFYILPVAQVVYTYNKVFNNGDQDYCYYNYLCAHPVGPFYDFNHLFTNVGYVLLGFLFIFITYFRRRALSPNPVDLLRSEKYNVPRHYGYYYAMGMALIMEGGLSASYHVCPNGSNFHFDTSFMYMIATLCIMKMYHSRQPDASAPANSTFISLALAMLMCVVGVFYGSPVVLGLFTVIHLGVVFYLTVIVYCRWGFMADLKKLLCCLRCSEPESISQESIPVSHEPEPETRLEKLLRRLCCGKPELMNEHEPCIWTAILVNLFNWALALASHATHLINKNYASHMLFIFMLNAVLIAFIYLISKRFKHKERIGLVPISFIILSLITWIPAMYFFVNASASWELSPAESRVNNKACMVVNFFDNHDLWHLLSSIALFFTFMVLLTWDDDLVWTKRENIVPIF